MRRWTTVQGTTQGRAGRGDPTAGLPAARLLIAALLAAATGTGGLSAGETEGRYYRIVTIPVPEEVALEVSGLDLLPDGRIAAAVRRGEIWLLGNVYEEPPEAVTWHRFASGLHEPLGLLHHDGALYTAQRAELTRLRDTRGDGRADEYTTVAAGWGVSGNYHEYAFGPVRDGAGNLWVGLNVTIGDRAVDEAAWRGWSMKVGPDGELVPVSAGLRSPSGLGVNRAGDVFATDQEGNWVGTCPLVHLRPGAFHGHVQAFESADLEGSTVERPQEVPAGLPWPEAKRRMPALTPPAVWFPYIKMGRASTDVLLDDTGGRFGPFEGQLFVGDFTMALVSRVDLEKVEGEYQGACFPFLDGFQSGVLRLAWGADGSMFVGQTNRGWSSLGSRSYGLQRVVWSGRTPFEIRTMRARPDGFELGFTKPVDRQTACDPAAYRMSRYTYLYRPEYGSDEIDTQELEVREARVSEDGRRVRLVVDGLRELYVHELHVEGVRSADGRALRHAEAYYTLNRIPGGP